MTNAGTFAVQVDGSALTALQLIDDVVHSGDAVLSKYAVIGAVFDDTAPVAVTENQAQSLRMTSGRALHTAVQSIAAGDNNIGNVDVVTLPALVAGTANIGDVDVLTLPALVAGTANIGDVDVLTIAAGDNNIGNVDVVTGPTGATAFAIQGTVAHDAADAQSPVKIGGKANLNEPTAVADADRVDAWFDQLGRLIVLPGHANPEAPVTVNGTAAGLSVIAAPGASLSLYICKGVVTNAAAAENIISLRDGAAGTIRWTINAAADGGGALFDFGARGWKLTANTALVADIGAATGYVSVTEYYIAA